MWHPCAERVHYEGPMWKNMHTSGTKFAAAYAKEGQRKNRTSQCQKGSHLLFPTIGAERLATQCQKHAAAFVEDELVFFFLNLCRETGMTDREGGIENIETGIPWLAEINWNGGAAEDGTGD